MPAIAKARALSAPRRAPAQMVRNMRDHVETLNGILGALAADDFDGASKIANESLGLDLPAAAACKPEHVKPSAGAARFDGRDDGLVHARARRERPVSPCIHQPATFLPSRPARRRRSTHKAAIEALSRVTQNCVACHWGISVAVGANASAC